jgi:hypothetical protein
VSEQDDATVTDPVQRQLECYNARDLEGFLACYDPDVRIRHGDGRELWAGLEQMRARYGDLFTAHPGLRATVPQRLRAGDWTVDEERVSWEPGQELHVLVAYRVRGGLIDQVVMLRSDL